MYQPQPMSLKSFLNFSNFYFTTNNNTKRTDVGTSEIAAERATPGRVPQSLYCVVTLQIRYNLC